MTVWIWARLADGTKRLWLTGIPITEATAMVLAAERDLLVTEAWWDDVGELYSEPIG